MLRRVFVNLGFNSPSEAEKALKKSNRKDGGTRAQKGRLLNRPQMEKIRALPPPGEVKRQEVLDATPAIPPASAQRTMGLPSQAATAEDNRRLGVQVLRVVNGGVAPTGLPRPPGKSRFPFARKKAKTTDAKSTLPDIRDTNDNALVNMRTTDLPNVRDLYTNKKDNAVPVASEGASATTWTTGSHQAMSAMQSEEEPGASMGHRTERQKAKELKQMKRAGLTPLRPPPHRNTMEDDADHKARMNKLKRARIGLAKNRVNPERGYLLGRKRYLWQYKAGAHLPQYKVCEELILIVRHVVIPVDLELPVLYCRLNISKVIYDLLPMIKEAGDEKLFCMVSPPEVWLDNNGNIVVCDDDDPARVRAFDMMEMRPCQSMSAQMSRVLTPLITVSVFALSAEDVFRNRVKL
ncbi:predicted protein [Nematostella vectensis]|uniref:Uncharacterized protein n=1 Tax=Nematostella vectensis TaxID=45351 RepID=A8DUP8_NEMVE|nr:predicted protein [Nematostella vectensis]|eukprot:XP_001620773.1 hypothetical protein NEMVEDRAFT_v1g222719 [Nematostella vectensis]